MGFIFKRKLIYLLLPLVVTANPFPSLNLDFSTLSSLSKMGKQLDDLVETEKKLDNLPIRLTDDNQTKQKKDEVASLYPYLNKGTKKLEQKYPWLYEKMQDLLLNKENIEAYAANSAYFQILEDLNGDGISELFLYNSYRCGSGGCNFKIYQIDIKNKKLKEIFDLYDNYDGKSKNILSTSHDGWKDIKLKKCYGSIGCKEIIFQYYKRAGYGVSSN